MWQGNKSGSFFSFFPSQLFLLHRSSLFGNFYNKMSHMMPSSKDQSKRSITKQMSPALAAQLEGLWKESTSHNNRFHEPEMQQITKVGVQVGDSSKCKCTLLLQASIQPFKRDAQHSGYNYLPPSNPLQLPSEKLQV